MTPSGQPLSIDVDGAVAILTFNRPHKRNAINDELIESLGRFFAAPPPGVRAAVLTGAGDHFCAGLDLSEHKERDAEAVMHHSQMWHRHLHAVQFGGVPVVSAMNGAVIGGGLEIAASTHVRVAGPGAFYGLPEATRGIYVGGGASVRVARLMGAGRMAEMMLTGRVLNATEGQSLGLSHYVVDASLVLERALELARRIASNARLSNYAILNAVARIESMPMGEGLFTESLMAAVVHTGPEAKERLADFLEKRAPRLAPGAASEE
jgi:enoyl-CoA hydratase/carnithine racemase